MYRSTYLSFLGVLLLATPTLAQTNVDAGTTVDNNQTNQSETFQTNSGSVQNVGILNQTVGDYNFGPGIKCPSPSISVSGYSNFAGSSNASGAIVSLNFPLEGITGSNCKKLTSEILKQKQLDTYITLVKTCFDFNSRGISLDSKVYPELTKACKGVKLTQTSQSNSIAPKQKEMDGFSRDSTNFKDDNPVNLSIPVDSSTPSTPVIINPIQVVPSKQ